MSSFNEFKIELKEEKNISSFKKLKYSSRNNISHPIIGETDNSISYSINHREIEKILMKYILNNEVYINNTIHVNLISEYLFNSKKLQSFIHLNGLTINDFIPIILNSKIILSQNNNCIYKQGEEYSGFFALFKGSITIKVSKLNCTLEKSPNYREEILKEYNLEPSEVTWINNSNNNDCNTLNNSKRNNSKNKSCSLYMNNAYSSIFNPPKKKKNIFRRNLILYSRQSINELNIEYSKEKDLCTYEIKNNIYSKSKNEVLIFGGINLFNEYMIDKPQIHLSSVYSYSNNSFNKYIKSNCDTILLYFREESLKNLREKIKMLNKARIQFLSKKLVPLNQMILYDFSSFISNIKLIYIQFNEKKYIQINDNTIFLIYKGECYDDINKNIIYDEGDFMYLNNIFENNNNTKIINLYSKSSKSILFQIDLGVLSNNNLIIMKEFLSQIYEEQINIRKDYNRKKYDFNIEENNKEKNNNKQYILLNSNKLLKCLNYKNNLPKKKETKNLNKSSGNFNYKNRNKKLIKIFLLISFNKNIKQNIFNKNNSFSKVVKFKLTKINTKKINNFNNSINQIHKEYYSKNMSDTFKDISTKNSTNEKIRTYSKSNTNSNILYEYSTKITNFNENKEKMEEIKLDKSEKYINLLNNYTLNNNIRSSLIVSRKSNEYNNNIFNNEYRIYNKNKSLTKSHFHKKIFLENVQQNINILKYIYNKNNKSIYKKSNIINNFNKNKKIKSFSKEQKSSFLK